jgi:hypothetical protein
MVFRDERTIRVQFILGGKKDKIIWCGETPDSFDQKIIRPYSIGFFLVAWDIV